MNRNENNTLDDILSAAKAEFSEKGFQSASLRRIVKNADVTTGALYGYFKSKEELFDALVGEQYDTLMGMFCETQSAFTKLSPQEQAKQMGELSGEGMIKMMDYCYANKDEFKLILCSSDGTKYENIIHDMAEIEVDATHKFAKTTLEHILASGLFSAFFEVIIHDIPHENAAEYLEELKAFYTAGWKKIMGF